MEITGEKVVIMGGTSGIGLATAKMLAANGAEVIVTGREASKLEKAVAGLGTGVTGTVVDGASRQQVRDFFSKLGHFHHLVLALSGGEGGGEFRTLDLNKLRSGFEAKFWPQVQVAQASLDFLDKGGSLTFVTALSARVANPGTAGLGAINAAIEAMIPTLALELKPTRVNAVSPGVIDTPWWHKMPAEQRQGFFAQAANVPAGRIGQPEDVAETITFLIKNSFITGTVIECDGGLHLK